MHIPRADSVAASPSVRVQDSSLPLRLEKNATRMPSAKISMLPVLSLSRSSSRTGGCTGDGLASVYCGIE